MDLTSKNPEMKFDGNLLSPLKFSSWKYVMTWFDCFQKFMISYCLRQPGPPRLVSHRRVFLYLVIRVALEKQHVNYGQLVDVSVSLELLSNPRTDDRHWKGNIVHRLDLWCLRVDLVRQPTAFAYSMGCLAFNRGTMRPLPQHTARTHSRYADVTRLCASPQLAAAWRSVLAGKRPLLGVLTLARLARELRRRDTHSGWSIVRGV